MKKTVTDLLILGGFDYIISFIQLPELIANIVSGIFIALAIWIIVRPNNSFFTVFYNKYVRFKNYLMALGLVDFLLILMMGIPGFIFGYLMTKAEYENTSSSIVEIANQYLQYTRFIYIFALFVALLWATYISFVKKKS